ncbi:MAG: polyphosphate--AMP phosphotransferase [Coriobacteriia bacterium]|nr:polyphosphate--AMP phosphotransferase [Coriobacteriia bacterium]
MLEKIKFDNKKIKKQDFKDQYKPLINELVVLQQKARSKGIGLVVLFEGWNGSGKGSRISDLMYNLDARSSHVYVPADLDFSTLREFSGLEMGVTGYFPYMQEFWQQLGARGDISFFDRGWYNSAVQHLIFEIYGKDVPLDELSYREQKHVRKMLFEGKGANKIFDKYIESAKVFEKQLVDDGYVVVKFFIHMTKEAQFERLTKMYQDSRTRYRVNQDKLSNIANYEDMYVFYDKILEMSEQKNAPWILLNGEDKRDCNLTIAKTLVNAINDKLNAPVDKEALAAEAKAKENSDATVTTCADGKIKVEESVLKANKKIAKVQHSFAPKKSKFQIIKNFPNIDNAKHDLVLDDEEYKRQRKIEQKRFRNLEQEMYRRRVPLMILYEGWDAAGKGGNIKRLAQAIDARAYNIFTSPAPTKVELAHPHLWRYWTRLPKAGHVGIYDRSWYGRVLVERVEGFATPAQWSRAYDEINEFEHDLEKWGAILLKFWVDISRDEQLNRFHLREQNPDKSWKLTDEDWRNRDKYPQYKSAVQDMFRLTSTKYAPWIILESDNKKYARIKALKIVNEALEKRLIG